MNNARREKLRKALAMISEISSIIDQVCDEEQECLENFPENLQGTDRYDAIENAADSLTEAVEKLGEVEECIQAAI